MNENNSGTNTVLIVIVLLLIVAGIVWYFTQRGPAQLPAEQNTTDSPRLDVEVNLPGGNTNSTTSSN